MKTKAFPNETFKDQNEYFAFCDKYKLYGTDAYKLKKMQDRKSRIPLPRLKLDTIGGE